MDRKKLAGVLSGFSEWGADPANKLCSPDDLSDVKCFSDGSYTDMVWGEDVKLELYGRDAVRFCDLSAGMAFTLPYAGETSADYTLAKLRTQIFFDGCVLTASAEDQNPYSDRGEKCWHIYVNEWLLRHLLHPAFYENQHLTLLNRDRLGLAVAQVGKDGTSDGERPYPTALEGDRTFRAGYEVYRFDIRIDGAEDIERPFYHIGVIRKLGENIRFGLFVLKSDRDRSALLDAILRSYTLFTPSGTRRNYFTLGAPKEDPHWNEETRAFFRKFMTQRDKSWGVFSYSMPGEEDSLLPGEGRYDDFYADSLNLQHFIENEIWGGKKFDVYMTYTHLGKGAWGEEGRTPHYYPLAMSRALAGGNGFDDRPVLEFTYQFTTNNNLVGEEVTPMFDILRGRYDGYFERLGRDIKAYGKPVMFRLNNEMNSDWTSYSGMMTLLDPDIFTMTWRHLYDIFMDMGCENIIWVWNPIARSCPYSGWGEDLCYFPGKDYVQLLGGTSYEMNNYTGDAAAQMTTFRAHYKALYDKNEPYFADYGMIVGEFACGSGGGTSGAVGRNAHAQAEWIRGMFEELNKEDPEPYVRQIKGLIWFNCNDYAGETVMNRFKFADAPCGKLNRAGERYDDLKETWDAFREGFRGRK